MGMRNTKASYGWPAKTLHWAMALLLVSMVALGLYMGDLPRGEQKSELIRLHASSGLLALMLLLIRFGWKLANETPDPPNESVAKARIAKVVHWGLYAVVLVQVATGSMSLMTVGWDLPFYDMFSIPTPFERDIDRHHFWEELHEASWYVFAALMLLHLGAVVYHQLIEKTPTLRRML